MNGLANFSITGSSKDLPAGLRLFQAVQVQSSLDEGTRDRAVAAGCVFNFETHRLGEVLGQRLLADVLHVIGDQGDTDLDLEAPQRFALVLLVLKTAMWKRENGLRTYLRRLRTKRFF